MRVCDMISSMGRMQRAAASLREQWLETREYWNDATARKFEETYLEPLGPEFTLTISAIQQFTDLIHRAERECDDRQEPGDGE